ncbi:MAG: hypothetical protein WCG55_04140 [bacterium]
MKKTLFVVVGIVVLVLFVGIFWVSRLATTPTQIQGSYKDATYSIDGTPVTLVNGFSAVSIAPGSASMVTTRYFGNETFGGLNNDGTPDVAFLLTQNTGGSGTFYYLVAALKTANGYQGTNAVVLGDRIAPQTTEITNGTIVVNYADRKQGDPMTTAPSEGVSKYARVVNGVLTEIVNPNEFPVVYTNTEFGFTYGLPLDWQGYSIVTNTWNGNPLNGGVQTSGPKLLIRNPRWTATAPYEDIPVLIFTISQWNSYQNGDLAIGAAPIEATEITRNNTYVFALPPRWDFDYSLGFKEAEHIVESKTLRVSW